LFTQPRQSPAFLRQKHQISASVVSRIDLEEGKITVDFDGREVTYGFGELDELVLAYATTIHKSQGSEYPAVVIPFGTQHYPMLQRNLVTPGDARRAAGRPRRAAQGTGDRHQGSTGATAMVEAPGVARRGVLANVLI
jgi:hypothetical protein